MYIREWLCVTGNEAMKIFRHFDIIRKSNRRLRDCLGSSCQYPFDVGSLASPRWLRTVKDADISMPSESFFLVTAVGWA
jgi:hypothetical protein